MKKLFLILSMMLVASIAHAQQAFYADAKVAVKSYISVNNTTAVAVKPSAGTVYSVDAFNNGASLAYVKLYAAVLPFTCGTGTPFARYLIPYGASSSGGGFNVSNINGDAYSTGIVMCITTGIADNDTGAPAANQFIVNVHIK